jgi:hypothetical protein
MVIIFIIQFITGIVGLSVKNSGAFTENVSGIVKPMFEFNRTTFETDFFQKHFKCCGWSGYSDYLKPNGTNYEVPLSCCTDPAKCDPITLNVSPSAYVFTVGCQAKIVQTFSKVIEAACGILVAMSLINLISVGLSFILARQIKTGYQFT